MNAADLIAFSAEVAQRFENKEILGPVHLNSDTQAEPLIEIFKDIKRTDWVLSTWRSSWHALLHGVPRDLVMMDICSGRSMSLHYPQYRFMTSAIMGGMLPIACGLAAGGAKVNCFVGDMARCSGAYQDAMNYAHGHELPVTFICEDNGLSTNTPTGRTWGIPLEFKLKKVERHYFYKRTTDHYQPLPSNGGF